jgi:hypothetical protein
MCPNEKDTEDDFRVGQGHSWRTLGGVNRLRLGVSEWKMDLNENYGDQRSRTPLVSTGGAAFSILSISKIIELGNRLKYNMF